MTRSALICGLAGSALPAGEAKFLRESRPAGIILFARNCTSHDQIIRLVSDARAAIGEDDVLVLIDQEGGRVQRLRPPLGRALPPAARYGVLFDDDPQLAQHMAKSIARLVAADLSALGINTDCAPVVDVPVAGSHDIIGDRAYGRDPAKIVSLGRAVAEGFMDGGVLPVIKHIPGHGRATKDSHFDLPVVSASHAELSVTDFEPFRALSDLPAAMTAHVVFDAIDKAYPASTSEIVTRDIIRGEIGFDGLLMSDDLRMRALAGDLSARARAVIAAGSDIALHCGGDLDGMRRVAEAVPSLAGKALARFDRAIAVTRSKQDFDVAAATAALERTLAA